MARHRRSDDRVQGQVAGWPPKNLDQDRRVPCSTIVKGIRWYAYLVLSLTPGVHTGEISRLAELRRPRRKSG